VFDSSIADANEMAIFFFLEFKLEMLRICCMEEWYSKDLAEFVQLMISYLIRRNHKDYYAIPLQISAMSRGCFTSYKIAWDLDDFTTY
jgi:hypothetical protein